MNNYQNVLIKLSGAAIAGEDNSNFDQHKLDQIAVEVLSLVDLGINVSLMIGGGNIFRGNQADVWGIDRVEADNIGTLGTVINSLMLRGVLKSKTNREVRVMTAMPIPSMAEPYIRLKALNHLQKGYVLIFAGGNGQPFVSTDYPAVQRAIEMNCDAIFVAKNGISGVYNQDPNQTSEAKQYASLHYNDVWRHDLKVMDQSALLLARDNQLPVHVFDFKETDAMKRICLGEKIGTLIHDGLTVFVE
ncbi:MULTISPECIES: UMP kinase [unclassified Exiguobacterium]|uniref:UMP kinase n=1 Tax=unclassified Exiguobacterium TaxID=2644629 RepID=UPI0008D4082C|nr:MULTISPECIES: UMP kinase [unclassified Exiguobacterium]OGX80570.1 UMP kinase [Exiguobacterium sp. SH31]TCI35704.1 UMP kinase [Exiguobacterium sp. SH4S7]TCI43499.1 UMP kinase [Exiguobacterium sp. SH5S32]TCI52447.1 UMP kinase [Exiguobacterium sp. SH1S4]TCI68754.1 UMP kinase [Exiguobacterium sp. SH1S1]